MDKLKVNKTIWLFCGIASFLLVLCIDVITDVKLGEGVNHTRGALIRTLGLIPSLVFFIMAKGVERERILWIGLIALIMMGFNYLNLFDGFYNLCRGYSWFFTGSEDGAGDAKTDNFFQAIPIWLTVIVKIGGSIGSIYLYKKIY